MAARDAPCRGEEMTFRDLCILIPTLIYGLVAMFLIWAMLVFMLYTAAYGAFLLDKLLGTGL